MIEDKPYILSLLEPSSAQTGPITFKDSRRSVAKDYHLKKIMIKFFECYGSKTNSLVFESGFFKNVLQPVPLVSGVMVEAMSGLLVGGQVEGGVQGNELKFPSGQVYLVISTWA